MILLTAEGILVSWGLSPVDTTSMQRITFHKPSSNQAIRIVSVSCCTLCPCLDGPSGHVNERAIRSGITVVTLLNCIYKGPCPPLYVYRLRFRPCSGTTSRFSSVRIASRSCSCLLPSLPCQVLHSRSISSDCSSFYHFVEPLGDPTACIFIEFCIFTEAICVLVLVTGTVLYDHVVSIQAPDPTTNITLVHRIGFQPGKGTIIHM